MKFFLSAVFFALVSMAAVLPASALGALDGKIFSGQVVDKAKGVDQAEPDTFEFAGGKLKTSLGAGLGFGAGKYTTTTQDSFIKFEALATNKTGGKMKCSGMVRGRDIEGILTTAANGKTGEFWFKGRLQ